MHETEVVGLNVQRRRRGWPTLDIGPFFMFFGIAGTDHGREARMERRFEQEYFSNAVTLHLASALSPGTYALHGLPEEANKRGWTVGPQGGNPTGHLSADGLDELRGWMRRTPSQRDRRVRPERMLPPA
ncbi:hypothetical protein GCM10010840_25060 [Deinococcus aerolatus]|uniref:Uncharacterized protein n=1 Tax=Deinococcus aerolatus TaxID=522487 RepID=A0ABQ2GD24_9DEIO|nr:hypothetical protein [Deinococcus aerolatus]GGL86110.1 hypothetical protein GCM10010840_25060 [Deinococcus aerolatus]